ncbi:hypothetical protein H4S00_004149 [Coemansia sp. D1744]|nr:hypothetical protein H4S00_004149 [Coemansia sp. D1744]
MGKAQKRTFKSRTNPLGTATVPGAATAVESKDDVPVLLKKLSSSDASDRVWAAASASNLLMSDDETVRRMLLSNNVISALVERLSDSVPDVVVQVSGALYNLAAVDHGAAVEISRRNIYGAIQSLIPRLATSIDGIIKNNEEGQRLGDDGRKMVLLTTDNMLSLLRVLCETVPASVKQVNDMALIPFVISFFKVADRLPPSLVQTAGQFLHTLTDENTAAKRTLLGHGDAVNVLFNVVKAQQLGAETSADDTAVVRMLAGAVLMNLKDVAIEQLETEADKRGADVSAEDAQVWDNMTRAVLEIVSGFISFDPHEAAARALHLAETIPVADVIAAPEASKQEMELDRLGARMDYIQMALELAANIFTDEGASAEDAEKTESESEDTAEPADGNGSDDDMGNDEDEEDDDAEHEDDGDEGEADLEDRDADFDADDMNDVLCDEGAAKKETEEAVRQSVLGVFIDAIVPSLLRLAEPTVAMTCAAESARLASVAEDFAALNERALGCFNNFLLVIEESLKAWFRMHADRVDAWWRFLIGVAERLVGSAADADPAAADRRLRYMVLDRAIGCMWTLARGVGGEVPATPDQIEGLIFVCSTAPDHALRVKAVGVLGNIARRQPGHVDANRRIGLFLVDHVIAASLQANAQPGGTCAAVEPVAEALDLLFDIYGDMAYDYDEPVFVREKLLPRLRQMLAPMRSLCKTVDRRKHRSLRDRCDLATQNLRAFIEYKATERK